MKAICYVRASSVEANVERQREAMTNWANQPNVRIIFVAEETASGVSKSEDSQ